jgi:hypothetical protein
LVNRPDLNLIEKLWDVLKDASATDSSIPWRRWLDLGWRVGLSKVFIHFTQQDLQFSPAVK